MFIYNKTGYECPFDYFINLLKGKWRTTIIVALATKPRRFSQLQRLAAGISAKVLADNLEALEAGNILTRKVYPTVPPIVEYSLTAEGIELAKIMETINQWAHQYMQQD